MTTSEMHRIEDTKTARMLRELASDLCDQVQRGEITDVEANAWYDMKANQWAQGLS